jgi:chemotaxis protein methyltransferase CheR
VLSGEVAALFAEIGRVSGRDFSGYACSSRERVLDEVLLAEGLASLAALRQRIVTDAGCLARTLYALSVPATALFRDAAVFRALRERVVPELATHPSIRVWIAGCASGEEAWSVAVLLHEAGLLSRSTIYATDLNAELITTARTGAYSQSVLAAGATAWRMAGGGDLAAHLTPDGGGFSPAFAPHLVFAVHDLGCDAAFNDFQLILCRNVLIYFDDHLRQRALGLLQASLTPFGILGLGAQEMLSQPLRGLKPCDPVNRLYRWEPIP